MENRVFESIDKEIAKGENLFIFMVIIFMTGIYMTYTEVFVK